MSKQAIIDALRAFVAQRPGFEFGNYGDVAAYRADMRTATRQRHDAERLIREVELRDSITAEDILKEADGGRVSIEVLAGRVAVDYTAAQYYCTEYRGAVARLMASVLWSWKRDKAMPLKAWNGVAEQDTYEGVSAGDWLRASFRREFGRSLAERYFS